MRYFELDKNSFSRYLGRTVCMFLELEHSNFPQIFRLVNNTKAIEVDGKTFEPFPFDIILPSQTEQQGTQIVLSNINNYIANEIKKVVNSNEDIHLQLYIGNIETQEVELYDKGHFIVTEPVITPESVTATVNIDHCLDYNLGTIRFNRQLFPNLYL